MNNDKELIEDKGGVRIVRYPNGLYGVFGINHSCIVSDLVSAQKFAQRERDAAGLNWHVSYSDPFPSISQLVDFRLYPLQSPKSPASISLSARLRTFVGRLLGRD